MRRAKIHNNWRKCGRKVTKTNEETTENATNDSNKFRRKEK